MCIRDRVVDLPRGARGLGVNRVVDGDAEARAVAEVMDHLLGEPGEGDGEAVEAALAQVDDDAFGERHARDRHHGFGDVAGERAQAGAVSGAEDDGSHRDVYKRQVQVVVPIQLGGEVIDTLAGPLPVHGVTSLLRAPQDRLNGCGTRRSR